MNEVKTTDIPDDVTATLFAALSNPVRLKILRHLACNEMCHCKDVVGEVRLAQSTVSQHLKILVDAGLVRFARHQQTSRYSISPIAVELLSRSVARLAEQCCSPKVTRTSPHGH
jgi:ArsR family transcriptional regulator, arsenate/arsenite/antimonite-responsive transcriptional repressor